MPRKYATRLVAAWTAGAVALAGVPAASADPVALDPDFLAAQLFAAQVQTRDGGHAGLRRLAVSAAFVEWRRQNPYASAAEADAEIARGAQQLQDALRPADALLNDADYALKIAAVLAAEPGSLSASASHVRALVAAALGGTVDTLDTREDLVNGSLRTAEWQRARGDVETGVWTEVRARSLADPAFAAAWNRTLGDPLQIDAAAPLAAIAADPRLAPYVDLAALLAHQGSEAELLAEVRRQFQLALTSLSLETERARGRLEQISWMCPLETQTPACTPEVRSQASTSAQEAQKAMDAIAAAARVLGQIAKLVDPKYGETLVKTATAWWSLFTAINKYADAVSNRNATSAIFSGASLVLAGNILGVVMTLAGMLGQSGPTVDQQILQQVVLLRQEVRRLHQEMRASFQRIDQKLDQIFAAMMVQFDRLGQAIAGNTAALADVQNQLAEQDMRLESVAATILAAIGELELHDARTDVNRYIGYEDIYGQPIPNFVEYTEPENEFHYAATGVATHPAFVVDPDLVFDPGVRPDEVLNNSGEANAFGYLTRLAAARDPRIPDVSEPYANPSVWNFGARAYALLALQNPAYAVQVNDWRSREIGDEGDRLLERAQSFSRPVAGADPTNPIFTSLLADYRAALVRLGTRLGVIRAELQNRMALELVNTDPITYAPVGQTRTHDLFGAASQAVPAGALPGDSATVPKCNALETPPLSLSRPSNVSVLNLAPEMRLAEYAYSPSLEAAHVPQSSTCWEIELVDERTVSNDNYYAEYARIRLLIHTRFRWSREIVPPNTPGPAGDRAWMNARTASYTWSPEVRVFFECYQHCGVNPPAPFSLETWIANKWAVDKGKFQTSATLTTDAYVTNSVRARMNAFLWGRQREYYGRALAELAAPNQPLHLAMTDLGRAARQLQAYTRLGFPVALLGDDTMASLLFGPRSVPVNFPGNEQIESTFARAFTAYACQGAAPSAQSCPGGPFYPRIGQPHLDTSPYDPYAACTAPVAGVPGLPGDPVGDCFVGGATARLDALTGRYRHHSQLLASGAYVEEIPWIASTRATLPLVSTLVRTPVTP